EDFDLVVTMGLRFAAVLLRKKAGGSLAGIDLDGFIRQVDEMLAEVRRTPRVRPHTVEDAAALLEAAVCDPAADDPPTDHLAPATRQRLAVAATSLWLEWRAGGRRSRRMRRAFEELSAMVTRLRAVPLAPRLRRHAHGLPELARELGKHVVVRLELGDV